MLGVLDYVAWIAGTSGPSTSSGAGVGIAGGQHLVVTADVHWQAGRQNRSNLEGPLVAAIQVT